MDIKSLKYSIEHNSYNGDLIIFKYSDNNFIPLQYINKLLCDYKFNACYVESVEELEYEDMFFKHDNELQILMSDKVEIKSNDLLHLSNRIIICKDLKCDEEVFGTFIVEVPKLQQWQVKDYLYTYLEGVDTSKLDKLLKMTNYDIFRIDNEISKLKLFTQKEKVMLYDKFIEDGIFSDLSEYTIFNFANAIVKKDLKELSTIYRELNNIDVDPMGLLSILLTNFKNIITVQLANNPSPESCGLNNKQFWAVKYSCGHYTKDQLLAIYKFLTNIDKEVKTGELQIQYLIDYVVSYILSL